MLNFLLLLLAIIGVLASILMAIAGAYLLIHGIFEVELDALLGGFILLVIGVCLAVAFAHLGAYVSGSVEVPGIASVEAPSSSVCSCCEGGCKCGS